MAVMLLALAASCGGCAPPPPAAVPAPDAALLQLGLDWDGYALDHVEMELQRAADGQLTRHTLHNPTLIEQRLALQLWLSPGRWALRVRAWSDEGLVAAGEALLEVVAGEELAVDLVLLSEREDGLGATPVQATLCPTGPVAGVQWSEEQGGGLAVRARLRAPQGDEVVQARLSPDGEQGQATGLNPTADPAVWQGTLPVAAPGTPHTLEIIVDGDSGCGLQAARAPGRRSPPSPPKERA